MKSVTLFVLLTVVGCVVAQDQFLSYAGTTNNAPTFAYPTWSSGNCAPVANTAAPYVTFSNTYATSGVREVATVAEDAYQSSIKIFIYSGGFDPANPCTNVVGSGLTNNGADGFVDDFVYFTAGVNYTFVITSEGTTGGFFAINVFLSNATGTINGGVNSTWWPTPYIVNGECQADPEDSAPIGWYTWTQPTSGWFDIVATFANLTVDASGYNFYATAVLYQGTPSLSGLADDPCNDTKTTATYWVTTQTDYRGTLIAYVNLTAGVTYTAVFSSEDAYTAYWGLQVIPTRLRFYQNETLFNEPEVDSETDCAASGEDYSWDSYLFTASQSSAFFLSTQDPPYPWSQYSTGGSEDTYTWLYSGNNAGTFGPSGTPPVACPIIGSLLDDEYTGDGNVVFTETTAGNTYTAVITPYDSGAVGYPAGYLLWPFTGTPIGNFASTTSTGATVTTGTSTTGSTTGGTTGNTTAPTPAPTPTTSAPTPAPTTSAPTPTAKAPTPAPNSTITSTTTTTGAPKPVGTTSGASAVAVGVVAVVAAVAALL